MNAITDFDSFLAAARDQAEPQQLLFVFARTMLPEDADDAQQARYEAGQGGGLLPVMYVDKRPHEVAGFEALREESRQQGEDWDIVLAAALSGHGDTAPSDDDVEQAFSSIIRNIHAGGDLSGLLAFDHDGDPLRFVSGA